MSWLPVCPYDAAPGAVPALYAALRCAPYFGCLCACSVSGGASRARAWNANCLCRPALHSTLSFGCLCAFSVHCSAPEAAPALQIACLLCCVGAPILAASVPCYACYKGASNANCLYFAGACGYHGCFRVPVLAAACQQCTVLALHCSVGRAVLCLCAWLASRVEAQHPTPALCAAHPRCRGHVRMRMLFLCWDFRGRGIATLLCHCCTARDCFSAGVVQLLNGPSALVCYM